MSSLCSTPRGITGTFTYASPRYAPLRSGAQRLAASQVLSPKRMRRARASLRVLNASRHHRYFHAKLPISISTGIQTCSTPRGITGTFTPRWVTSDGCNIKCSTPRGITGTFTYPSRVTLRVPNQVLNASRHHRYFHPHYARSSASSRNVLNASRHHRYFHAAYGSREPGGFECSTPRGITGTFTTVPFPCGIPHIFVLNASRHHRYFHMSERFTLSWDTGISAQLEKF